MFTNYEKMLYFDCDMIFLEDVSKLYDTHLGEKEVAAVRAEDLRVLSQTRRAIFLDGMPYNVDNYRSDGLKMQYAEDYFNSGVLLLNLQKARQHITMSQVYELLTGHKYMFSDQDVLNMLFDGKVLPLDFSWNYTTLWQDICKAAIFTAKHCMQIFKGINRRLFIMSGNASRGQQVRYCENSTKNIIV